MEISLLGIIGIGLATMFFGYFFGLFEGRGQGYKRRQNEETLSRPEPLSTVGKTASPDRSLLTLRRDEAGNPQLSMDGQLVRASEIDANQRRRLIELMVLLRPWVEPTKASTGDIMREAGPTPERASTSTGERGGSGMASGAQGPLTAPDAVQAAAPASGVAESQSLVAQIDAILQARLAGTPLAGRGIRLAESLHGGALVFVGTTQYDGVDKVQEPDIQAAIKGAIAEWEKRYTPR